MSEKRFVIGDDNIAMFEVIDMEKEELVCECRAVDVETLVDLLNSLAEENELLNGNENDLKECTLENIQLKEENEQLRYVKNNCRKQQVRQANTIHKLIEENKQLRKTMNEVIELLVEEVDLFSDKATEHDIIAYTELQSFDNKDAYYIATATKKAIKILQGVLNE